mmetsp:Transcript_23260/g.26390  ORF Transcript_23260/g.26390 Transcript_23260/m.26390 type:complete len:100 (-) Transcript_23260:610-909(-)
MSSGKLDFVKLVSAEGDEFFVEKECAYVSNFIRNTLEAGMAESNTKTITFQEIKTATLEKIVQYLYYKIRYKDEVSFPKFDLTPEIALEVLSAAIYLDC